MTGRFTLIAMAVSAVLSGFIAAEVGYTVGHSRGHEAGESVGYARHKAELAISVAANERERTKDNADLQRLSDFDFCVRALRDDGVSIDACDVLK